MGYWACCWRIFSRSGFDTSWKCVLIYICCPQAYGYRNSFLIAGVCAAMCSLGYTQLPETLQKQQNPTGSSNMRLQNATKTFLPWKADKSPMKSSSEDYEKSSAFRKHLKAWVADVNAILTSRNQQALIALACELPIRFSCFTTAVALHASNVAGAGPKELGMLFTALAISQGLGMPVGSWLADRTSGAKKWMIVPGGIISSASFATLAFATSLEQLLAAMAMQGFCGGYQFLVFKIGSKKNSLSLAF